MVGAIVIIHSAGEDLDMWKDKVEEDEEVNDRSRKHTVQERRLSISPPPAV